MYRAVILETGEEGWDIRQEVNSTYCLWLVRCSWGTQSLCVSVLPFPN